MAHLPGTLSALMSNFLSAEDRTTVISALAEGSSIRAIERMTGIYRNTIMKLGLWVGENCQRIMHEKMRGLACKKLQLDEIWGFVKKKQKHVSEKDNPGMVGDMWTFVAIDADTKLVPCYRIGKRDSENANAFVCDLAGRLKNRVQLSTDALRAYVEAVEKGFGGEVDYGQIVKAYTAPAEPGPSRYSPPPLISVTKTVIVGKPDEKFIATSYIERQNLTMRMHMRRLTRLTNAFSKKLANFKAAVALHFVYYNFVKTHKTLRCTPAMAAGLEPSFWSVCDLIDRCA